MKGLYGQEYYRCDCGAVPYENTEAWSAQFNYLAERIIAVYSPRTVLDAGCAMGYLVAALRDRGVEAYGVDISDYAISKVREDVRPYCAVGSLTEPLPAPLPRRYDLVVTIEVLEHLMEEDGKKAIENLCTLSDTILFSSSPEDFAERTHFNVQQREYWTKLFSEHNFYDDLLCRPLWLTKHAITFVKKEQQTLPQLVWEYERNILRLQKEAAEREGHLQTTVSARDAQIAALAEKLELSERDVESTGKLLAEAQAEIGRLRQEIQDYSNLVGYEREQHRQVQDALHSTLNSILNSRVWRMTKPLRKGMDLLKKILRRLRRGTKTPTAPAPAPTPAPAPPPERSSPALPITGHPIDPVDVIRVRDKVRRLNLITDSLDGNSLLGGTATALFLATEYANRFDYELRIITRLADCNPLAYRNIMQISGVDPARRLRFYSDFERFQRALPFKMELSEGELFLATSWWSAKAIRDMIPGERFFYIIQEVETFFYHYGGERLLCEQMTKAEEIDYIVNSHYLFDYFRKEAPHIVENGISFEPAFPRQLYSSGRFEKKEKYKLFFYSCPNNPRNLFAVGVSLLDRAIETSVLDTEKWSICFVGQDVPDIRFCNGSAPVRMGQLSWTEYAAFLADVDLGLCLMYTPHPSYPPYDVACSGGVVLTNRFANKQSFEVCDNVLMTELNEADFLENLQKALELAGNMEQRRANYEASRIGRDWQSALKEAVEHMGRCSGDV